MIITKTVFFLFIKNLVSKPSYELLETLEKKKFDKGNPI